MRAFLIAGASLMVLSSAALAQNTNTTTSGMTQKDTAAPKEISSQNQPSQHLRANLRSMLEKSGYKDIQVMPSSFVVHARDSEGNPVVMSVSPDSFAEVTDLNASASTTTGTAGNSTAQNSETFVAVPNQDELSSKVVGLDIYNNSNQDIGQIKDIAFGPNGRSQAYIVSVGGFLGMGEHYVAVNPSSVKVSYNTSDKKWHAAMNASADQLKSAPEFKYAGRWEGNRS
jgi:sporulation protein YlmC with PRC-barrel domain